jgi:hypothetical protein
LPFSKMSKLITLTGLSLVFLISIGVFGGAENV